jgi:hypothetical protein
VDTPKPSVSTPKPTLVDTPKPSSTVTSTYGSFGSIPPTTLTLTPEQGDPKTQVTAAITPVGACGDGTPQGEIQLPTASVQWDGTPQTPFSIVKGDKGLTVQFNVPADASAGPHHVTATCGNTSAPVTFTVTAPENPPENPALALTPAQGGPATQGTATATGFGACRAMSYTWDDGPLQPSPVGGLVVNFAVPKDAAAGAHTVTARCGNTNVKSTSGADLIKWATATFTVTAPNNPPENPALALTPAQGGPATQGTATATGFGACGPMSYTWDDGPLQPSPVGGLVVNFTVPKDAAAGAHTVKARCGDSAAPATFTVVPAPIPVTPPDNPPENPALALMPAQGGPATQGTATATGFGACGPMSYTWDDGPLQPSPVGGLVVNFTVPKDAAAGAHTVKARCGGSSAPATFTVVSAPKPALTLDTGHGPGGSHLTASGTGFACGDGNVQLLWDRDTPLADASSGMFSAVPLTIPSDASTGGHTVVASCEHHPDIADSQRFTVTSATTPVTTTGPAALTLQPASGHPGDQLRATGDGFACANHSGPVNLSWDDGTPLPGASLDPAGHFEASVSVPAKTDARRLTLRAACSDGVVLAADFTVLASPQPPPAPPAPAPPKIPWLLIVLIVAGAILSAAEYARRRSQRPEARPHVQAVPRPDGSPVVTLRETPERGEATHALRLEAHSGLSTLTVREVDDDHTAE